MLRTIKTKFIVIVILLVGALIFLGVFSLYNLNQVNLQSTIISQNWIPGITISEELNTMTSDYRILEYQHIIASDSNTMANLVDQMSAKEKEIETLMTSYSAYAQTDKEKKLYSSIKDQWAAYLKYHDTMITLSTDMKTDEAMAIMNGDAKTAFDDASANFLNLANDNKDMVQKASDTGDATYISSRNISIAVISILSIGAIIFSTLVLISILASLRKLKLELQNLTERGGDLTQEIKVNSKDEIADLAISLNIFLSNLRQIIKNVKSSSEDSKQIGNEITHKVHSLANDVNEVSATTEELSAAMEENAAYSQEISSTAHEIENAIETIAEKSKAGAESANEINVRALDTKHKVTAAQKIAADILMKQNLSLNNRLKILKLYHKLMFYLNPSWILQHRQTCYPLMQQ